MQPSTAQAAYQEITTNTIYLMGGSFMLGSLFTLLLLVLLDFMQRNREKRKNPDVRRFPETR